MKRDQKTGAELIAIERQRQIEQEGFTPSYDSQHIDGELAYAAICYAEPQHKLVRMTPEMAEDRLITAPSIALPHGPDGAGTYYQMPEHFWPFDLSMWKPGTDRVRQLVKAGAMIAAEIDRIQGTRESVTSIAADIEQV